MHYALNMIGLIDCNNFYVSCERVFNPRLIGRRVAVLTNNDGCVVSRSPEFKKLNIPVGTPYFKIKDLEKPLGLIFISSNYELYADMSNRVMSVLRQFTPQVEQYSIDEAFIHFNLPEDSDYEALAMSLRERVLQWTGIPTGIGFASTRTLAKLGSEIAKKQTTTGVFVVPKNPEDILRETPVGDIWGVGPRVEKRLMALGVRTALQLAESELPWLQKKFSVCLVRTALELRGQAATAAEDFGHPMKTAACTRMFGTPIVDFEELRETVADYADSAAARLREAGKQAVGACVFFLYYPEYYPVALPEGSAEINVMFGHPVEDGHELVDAVADRAGDAGLVDEELRALRGVPLSRTRLHKHQRPCRRDIGHHQPPVRAARHPLPFVRPRPPMDHAPRKALLTLYDGLGRTSARKMIFLIFFRLYI